MTRQDREEARVRRLLDGRHPRVPTALLRRAVLRGERLLRLRRAFGLLGWTVLAALLLAIALWAAARRPWEAPPLQNTPPVPW
ncbi:hypothetical protein ACFV3R_20290 [Streptomyces sp. NPDC059740]|uniref:hypothetical protein n=1 Tax=Streptomyces sp. NPDC059740 TaxID=3346926 RepID=UPI003668B920